jgi:uncharacterized protein GlcG (DUF336 family)
MTMTKTIKTLRRAGLAAALLLASGLAAAQVPVYGTNATLDQARKALAAAMTEAARIKIPMAVAVVDTAGQLVAFERTDNTQTASVAVSQDKAVSAAMFRRSTEVFQDLLAKGGENTRILHLRNANAVKGGIPLTVDGKIIGAIGVSGGNVEQDAQCAKAGVDALAAK